MVWRDRFIWLVDIVLIMSMRKHKPVLKKGLNFGFTHVCSECGAYWDGKIWSWDVAPAKDTCLGKCNR